MADQNPQASRQQARPTGQPSRGLKIGNTVIPWWAIGAGVIVIAGVGYLWYRNRQSQPAATSNQSNAAAATGTGASTGSGTGTGAATIVPLPYPTSSSTTGSTAAASSGLGSITLGPAPGQPNSGIYSQDVAVFSGPSQTGAAQDIPFGSYQLAGSPQNNLYPIVGPGGTTLWALAENVSGFSNPSAQSLTSTQAS
jgi:hypothetical protein